jgi:hypothetical protein
MTGLSKSTIYAALPEPWRLAGKSLAFSAPTGRPGCRAAASAATLHAHSVPPRFEALAKKRATPTHRGHEVSSISYLPQTFTTLFFLAASLLLGLIR